MNSPMITNFYDLLDVAPDATEADIRAAWRSAIADLDPADRRFRVYNQAAEVLLDPQRRRAFDDQLAASSLIEDSAEERAEETAEAGADAGESPAGEQAAPSGAAPAGGAAAGPGVAPTKQQRTGSTAGSARREVPTWALAVLAAVTAVAVAASAWLWFAVPSDASVEESARAARSAAERAVVPILSYNALHLEEDKKAAQAYMTSDYREQSYDKMFAVIEQNAPGTKTIVRTDVIRSGIVRSGADRVQVLLFLDRPTTNKQTTEPIVYHDQATVTMERVDGEWLVDDLISSPVPN
jgi:Mce-associated membrane protein